MLKADPRRSHSSAIEHFDAGRAHVDVGDRAGDIAHLHTVRPVRECMRY